MKIVIVGGEKPFQIIKKLRLRQLQAELKRRLPDDEIVRGKINEEGDLFVVTEEDLRKYSSILSDKSTIIIIENNELGWNTESFHSSPEAEELIERLMKPYHYWIGRWKTLPFRVIINADIGGCTELIPFGGNPLPLIYTGTRKNLESSAVQMMVYFINIKEKKRVEWEKEKIEREIQT